jgi:hypothetical protein
MTDEQMGPPTADAHDAAAAREAAAPGATGAAGRADAPSPGDPNYDAFLREVQRLADERQATQAARRGSGATRMAVRLVVLFLVGAIGLALVLSVWWGVFGESALATGAAIVGLAGLVIGVVLGIRVTQDRRDEVG